MLLDGHQVRFRRGPADRGDDLPTALFRSPGRPDPTHRAGTRIQGRPVIGLDQPEIPPLNGVDGSRAAPYTEPPSHDPREDDSFAPFHPLGCACRLHRAHMSSPAHSLSGLQTSSDAGDDIAIAFLDGVREGRRRQRDHDRDLITSLRDQCSEHEQALEQTLEALQRYHAELLATREELENVRYELHAVRAASGKLREYREPEVLTAQHIDWAADSEAFGTTSIEISTEAKPSWVSVRSSNPAQLANEETFATFPEPPRETTAGVPEYSHDSMYSATHRTGSSVSLPSSESSLPSSSFDEYTSEETGTTSSPDSSILDFSESDDDLDLQTALLLSLETGQEELFVGDISSQALEVFVDSSGWGVGFVMNGQWLAWEFKKGWKSFGGVKRDNTWAEAVAVELGVRTIIEAGLPLDRLVVRSDNSGVVHSLRTGKAKKPQRDIVLNTLELAKRHNVGLTVKWISTKANPADRPSRGDFASRDLLFVHPPRLPGHLVDLLKPAVSFESLTH